MTIDLLPYVAGAQARVVAQEAARLARRERAWQSAREAAVLLADRFGARRVAVFGSLAEPTRFFAGSDIDLAVWGIPAAQWYRAVFELMGGEFEINLVDPEGCRPSVRDAISQAAVDLVPGFAVLGGDGR